MTTHKNHPGTPAGSSPQPPAVPSSEPDTPPSPAGGSPTPPTPPTPAAPAPPAPATFSGTWFQQDDPQILIQWTLKPAPTQPFSPPPDPASGGPAYRAQVRIYQQIFDAEFPNPPHRGPVVPFSVTDPSVGPAPYLLGSLVLSHAPLGLEVINLRFPGFHAQDLTLYSAPASSPGAAGGSAAPAGQDPETSSSGTSRPAAAEAAAAGSPED